MWCPPGGWDNMWCPPCRPPSPVSSPPSVWCLLGALWCPRMSSPPPCRPPSPVSSPPSVWCLLGALWCPPMSSPPPPCHPPSPVSSPPSVWCLPGGWDNMWYPPRRPPSPVSSPLARVVPPFSVVSPRSSVVSPCVVPPLRVVPPRNLARYVVPPLLQMRFQAKKTSNLKSRAAESISFMHSIHKEGLHVTITHDALDFTV